MQNSLYLTHFFKEKPICIFLTESKSAQTSIKISPITTNTTQNSIRHKIYTSKKNPSLYSQQDSLQQKKSSKVFILHPLSKGPEAHFPKHKYIWIQTHLRFPPNVKEFSQKLFRVFLQTPRHFRPKSRFSHRFSRIWLPKSAQTFVFIQKSPLPEGFWEGWQNLRQEKMRNSAIQKESRISHFKSFIRE